MGDSDHQDSRSPSTEGETVNVKRETSLDDDSAESAGLVRVSAIHDQVSTDPPVSPPPPHTKDNDARSPSSATQKSKSGLHSPPIKAESTDTNGYRPPKATPAQQAKPRGSSKKNVPRIAPLFDHLPDATPEANNGYQVIDSCIYQNKFLGYTEHAMDCDCSEEWDPVNKSNDACGEDSDCINRATKMECVGDCTCGPACQNQRFGRRLYASVSVIKTEKKGYGLRTNVPLKPGDFIFEYIGEVIPEGTFRKRMRAYDDEGIKHFYFMSLSKGEFVDATKKGNMGRFCNHSCNPNCYVDKWVVGDKLRMGIFAEKVIKAGEELVFNYNVDRYGANPQPCYCGESNCTGFIGGKTQTERATKLSAATIEALGIDDDWDEWDTVVAKKPKKKKTAEDDDEDYVDRAEIKNLDVEGVTKVMAALMQCKEKWIAVKLLQRMQRCDEEIVLHRIIQLHGYKILNSQLSAWREDENVILQILDILDKFPRLTRNKIVDAKIDQTLEPLKESQDERVASRSAAILEGWSKLELAYRIPRKARTFQEGVHSSTPVKFERRESQQQRKLSRSRSRSKSPPKGPSGTVIPTGPRNTNRPAAFGGRTNVPFSRGPPPLPVGWFTATDAGGRSYFYSASGETTWKRPSKPAHQSPSLPKQASQQDMLKDIINNIVTLKEKDVKTTTPDTPEADKSKDKKEERWRSYDEEKKKKVYENTLFPHIAYVMNKYKHKIPKDDLKRFAKDLAKKLVNSDFKAGRVEDPRKISEKQQKKVKAYCKEYFDKAAEKHKRHEAERAARKTKRDDGPQKEVVKDSSIETPSQSPGLVHLTPKKEEASDDEDIKMSDIEDEKEDVSPVDASRNGTLKRKRSIDEVDTVMKDEEDNLTTSPIKKLHIDSEIVTPTPPPPPPPPAPPAESPPEASTPVDDNEDDIHDHAEPMETDIHADTNFRGKSMADVLAQAQQEEDEVDWGMDDIGENKEVVARSGQNIGENGIKVENPLVEEQKLDDKVKSEPGS